MIFQIVPKYVADQNMQVLGKAGVCRRSSHLIERVICAVSLGTLRTRLIDQE